MCAHFKAVPRGQITALTFSKQQVVVFLSRHKIRAALQVRVVKVHCSVAEKTPIIDNERSANEGARAGTSAAQGSSVKGLQCQRRPPGGSAMNTFAASDAATLCTGGCIINAIKVDSADEAGLI
jgi:hypothetical protein